MSVQGSALMAELRISLLAGPSPYWRLSRDLGYLSLFLFLESGSLSLFTGCLFLLGGDLGILMHLAWVT